MTASLRVSSWSACFCWCRRALMSDSPGRGWRFPGSRNRTSCSPQRGNGEKWPPVPTSQVGRGPLFLFSPPPAVQSVGRGGEKVGGGGKSGNYGNQSVCKVTIH